MRSHPVLALALSMMLLAACQDTPPPPNILLVVADDLGWNDVGYHGSEIRTPNIDALAAAGVRFEQLYVQPTCSTSRAALLTGRYPHRMGLQRGAIRPWARHGLPLEERTLPEALKAEGYRTALMGKWHLGMAREAFLPTRRGFDHHYGHYGGSITYFSHKLYGVLDWHRNGEAVREKGYSTTLIADEAIRWLAEDTSTPFFLMVSFNAPHVPLEVAPGYRELYSNVHDRRRRNYAAVVTAMDDELGRIVESLRGDGRLADTLLVFLSDNGAIPPGGGDNSPLRGIKAQPYEGGVRVPGFVSWPGELPAGSSIRQPVHIIDFFPTLLVQAGASLDQTLPLDGRDFWPLLQGEAETLHDELLIELTDYLRGAIRRGPWKLIVRRMGRPDEYAELFNLETDERETRDLAAARPDIVGPLRRRLEEHMREAAPPYGRWYDMPPGFQLPELWDPEHLQASLDALPR